MQLKANTDNFGLKLPIADISSVFLGFWFFFTSLPMISEKIRSKQSQRWKGGYSASIKVRERHPETQDDGDEACAVRARLLISLRGDVVI